MSLPPPNVCKRIRGLFRLIGSPNANEAKVAHEKLLKLLADYSLTWNDITYCVAAADEDDARAKGASYGPASSASSASSSARATPQKDKPAVNVLDLVDRLVEKHIAVTPDQRMASALWILHTHVFGRFQITPRLALVSPVRGCGKTTLLIQLEQLCADPYRSDSVTPAAIYHTLEGREPTLLMDEDDNLGLTSNNILH